MADSDDAGFPDGPPPEVPEEFAAAYREAYHRAMVEGSAPSADPDHAPPEAPTESAAPGGLPGQRVTEYRAGSRLEHLRESAWFVPLVAVLLVLALVLGGWLLARSLGGDEPAGTPPQTPGLTGEATSESPASGKKDQPQAHGGPVEPVEVAAISATCTLAPGVDAAGRRVGYDARNAIDGKPTTAWRCEGDAVRQRLVLRLPEGTEVAAVGLVPGYAKTDPASGADRYAENNRITRVRWHLAEGVKVEQRLDPAPGRRDLQVLRVPRTATDRVVLEILAVERGSRGATAISEIRISAAR